MATLSFTLANFQISENGKVFTPVTITRTDGIGTSAVTVSLTAGTATAEQDYTSQSLTINFNAGETSKTVNIPILEDAIAENSETINLTLSSPVNSTLGTRSTATLTIIDNDKTWAGYADTILDYFDSGVGSIPSPYGFSNGSGNIPINLDAVLGDDPLSQNGVSLPKDSFITVGFTDEKVVDGPGNDIFITEEGTAGDQANIFVSSNYTDFTFLGLANGGDTSAFDLSSIKYTQPVRAVKIVSLDNNGLYPGFDLVNVQALNRDSTAGKITLKDGHSVNDPHLATFDGAGYDFQAVGEFTLVKSTTPTDDFEIQTRQKSWNGSTSASANSAIAIKSGGQKISVYADRSPKLLINDLPVTLADGGTVAAGGNSITLKGNKYEITTANKDIILVNDRGSFLNINIGLADNRNGKVAGLLGNDNDKSNDEFALRDGTVIGATISNDRLYGDYGNSWRITQPTSLFNYATGTSTSTFTDVTFPQKIVTFDTLTLAQRDAAEKIARDAGITDPAVLKDAIVDIFLTNGAPEFIQGALEQQKLAPANPVVGNPLVVNGLQGTPEGEVFDFRNAKGSVVKVETISVGDAAYKNNIGFYEVENVQGTLANGLKPGDIGYAEAAIRSAVLRSAKIETLSDRSVTGSKILAPVVIANGTFDDMLNRNPQNLANSDIHAYFNYLGANTDKFDHFKLLGPNKFGVEDLYGGGDKDFNDIVFQLNVKS
jgi:von Willebrand factor type D domain/Calx-beta domain/Domain of unknown function (DUF4114)